MFTFLKHRTSRNLMNIPSKMRRLEMIRKAKDLALQSTEWLSSADITKHSDHSDTRPSYWIANKQIFAITLENVDYLPAYALHEIMRGNVPIREPKPIIALLMDAMGSEYSGWQIAAWFASANGYLHGARPMDLLDREPERVIKAAKFAAQGVQHG
jgi:hypothetical protein